MILQKMVYTALPSIDSSNVPNHILKSAIMGYWYWIGSWLRLLRRQQHRRTSHILGTASLWEPHGFSIKYFLSRLMIMFWSRYPILHFTVGHICRYLSVTGLKQFFIFHPKFKQWKLTPISVLYNYLHAFAQGFYCDDWTSWCLDRLFIVGKVYSKG